MHTSTLDILRCPYCGGRLELVTSMYHETHEDEIDKLRKGMHDFKDEAKRSFWELLEGRFREFREEVRAWLRKDGG